MAERKGTRALELWCKRLLRDYPNIEISNMTTSWRNGIAFCALVHHFRPDLIDISSLKPENIHENNELAFALAEKHLGIPALLDPEDMVANEVPDRLSVLTYLSQFYQRLGHTVNQKNNDTEINSQKSPEPSMSHTGAMSKFGKSVQDKCAACDLPVYLAQRLIVSQKLYHRRCFRCSKCAGHLNPNNFKDFTGSQFVCESCKTNTVISKPFFNSNVQMGMLAYTDGMHETDMNTELNTVKTVSPTFNRPKPQSIMDKISIFENNKETDNLSSKLENLTLLKSRNEDTKNPLDTDNTLTLDRSDNKSAQETQFNYKSDVTSYTPSNKLEYKSSLKKSFFLKTQLLDAETDCNDSAHIVAIDDENTILNNERLKENKEQLGIQPDKYLKSDENKDIAEIPTNLNSNNEENTIINQEKSDISCNVISSSNMTDDTRIANSNPNADLNLHKPELDTLNKPPRRKKRVVVEKFISPHEKFKNDCDTSKEYPGHLNPFSDDEDEDDNKKSSPKQSSTNPFGSSDEEDNSNVKDTQKDEKPQRRLISANPFWSDGEEHSSDEDEVLDSSSMYNSSMATSTPNLRVSALHKKKGRAPPPPVPTLTISEDKPTNSMDDVASLSSLSSYNSTVHSDQRSYGKLTPVLKLKKSAPTPPDSISTISEDNKHSHDTDSVGKSLDSSGTRDASWRRVKGPAPGLPLPERREVKLQLTPEELQLQLDLLETQQNGLEKQGVMIEQMIRDKCENDTPTSVPQEEVEDLVIQLCELVNEKNDLFRKQTELMYIRRQQRLEQEQADIEHEIRVIQSRPAVNRIDADKAREEQLVSRLVEIVLLRDELVQQMDSERRREQQEDMAIATSIANKRAQRNSESNSSSMKSVEVVATPKKNKVKDKMKKQFKKAKHTLIPKKKDTSDKKEDKSEKGKK